MTQRAVGYEDCDIALESGRLRVRRWGAADAPAVVCVPGLSANLCGFDRLAERLAGDTLQALRCRRLQRLVRTSRQTQNSFPPGSAITCHHASLSWRPHRSGVRRLRATARVPGVCAMPNSCDRWFSGWPRAGGL